jgi:3-hydroxybutyryl-CoA dehydratase
MTSETGSDVTFEYDRDAVGVDVDLGTFQITGEQIATYCDALDEHNPLYLDEEFARQGPYGGIIAPPGILTTVAFTRGGPDPKVRFGNTSVLGGQRIESYAPLRPGQSIRAKTQVKDVFAKTGRSGTMVFVVRRTSYEAEDGTPLAASEQTLIHRQV